MSCRSLSEGRSREPPVTSKVPLLNHALIKLESLFFAYSAKFVGCLFLDNFATCSFFLCYTFQMLLCFLPLTFSCLDELKKFPQDMDPKKCFGVRRLDAALGQ